MIIPLLKKDQNKMRRHHILEALKNYVCQYNVADDWDIQLVDLVTPRGEDEITLGLMELELLADHIDDYLRIQDDD